MHTRYYYCRKFKLTNKTELAVFVLHFNGRDNARITALPYTELEWDFD